MSRPLTSKTGQLVWDGLAGEDPPAAGQFISVAPVVADGKVLVGVGSGDAGFRCRLAALDIKTGKQVWTFISIPGPGEVGHDTWPADSDAWEHGGGGVWATPTVDTELGLVIFGTGSAYPQYGGDVRPGANLYTASVVAVDLKTGKYKWHFQTAHHEIWESDVGGPEILYDAKVDGKTVKAVAALRTDGYLFLLDRKTGKPIMPVEERPVKQKRAAEDLADATLSGRRRQGRSELRRARGAAARFRLKLLLGADRLRSAQRGCADVYPLRANIL